MFTSPCRFGYCQRSRRRESLENLLQDLSGVWLGFHSWNPYLNSLQKQRDEKKLWSHKLILRGFVPGDIKVTAADDVVRVHARHVQESKGGNTDIHEATRNVKIPENVDTENLKCRLDQNNVLLIEGPFIDQEEEPAPVKQQKCDASKLAGLKNNGKEKKHEIEDENKKNCCDDLLYTTEEKIDANTEERKPLDTDESNRYKNDEENGTSRRDLSEYIISSQSTENGARKNTQSLEGDLTTSVVPSETPSEKTHTTDAEFSEDGKCEDQLVDDEADDKEFEIIQSDLDSHDENESEETPTLLLLQNGDNEEIHAKNSTEKELGRKTEDFQINLDVHNYPPENISVVRKDNSVTVKAEKKGERDGMEVSEQYVTQYSLPSNVNADKLSCVQNSEGKLVVTAPYHQQQ